MSGLSVVPFTQKSQSMPDPQVRYRIVHVDHPHWFWSVAGIWGLKADARIFTELERNVEALPISGLWEVIADGAGLGTAGRPSCADGPPPSDRIGPSAVRRPFDRSIVAQAIARLLWSQDRLENGLPLQRIEDAPIEDARRFHQAAEFITNWTLSPDRAETALMALADTFYGDGDGVLNIIDAPPRTQRHYYALAVAGFFALQQNVKEVPPDWHYRDSLCRTVDAILPKGGGL